MVFFTMVLFLYHGFNFFLHFIYYYYFHHDFIAFASQPSIDHPHPHSLSRYQALFRKAKALESFNRLPSTLEVQNDNAKLRDKFINLSCFHTLYTDTKADFDMLFLFLV